MANTVRIYREAPSTDDDTYTTIRLYSASSPGDSFVTLAGTATLASTTYLYSITDSSGTSATYYRYSLYNATGPVESSLSEVFQADGLTFKKLRYELARKIGAGFSSTCTSTGTTTTLVDATAIDDGVDTTYEAGKWIYRPDAGVSTDKVRRITESGFTVSSGTFTVASGNPWGNAPADDEEYGIFSYFPPIRYGNQPFSYDDAINEGLAQCWYIDRVYLTTGSVYGQRRFSLNTFLGQVQRDQIRNVYLRTVDANDIVTETQADRQGRFWDLVENGPQDLNLDLWPAPSTSETIVVEYNRRFSRLYNDTDVTICPLELAVRAGAWRLFSRLNRMQIGKYAAEEALAKADFYEEYANHKPNAVIV